LAGSAVDQALILMLGIELSLFAKGGPIMWVLLLLGALAVMLFIERTLYLHRGQIGAKAFLEGIKNILGKRRLVEALTVCEETPGPVAAVVKAALMQADASAEVMRFHVQEAAVVELPALERRLGAIAAVAQIAPLVGLLGTVMGMITTFIAFERGGNYAMASALSAGMWQALLATAGSLMLAIPAHLAHHFLVGRVRSIVRDVEWSGNEIMKYLLTDYRDVRTGDPARSASAPMADTPVTPL
jgi:biopolymer transport protein ExbB